MINGKATIIAAMAMPSQAYQAPPKKAKSQKASGELRSIFHYSKPHFETLPELFFNIVLCEGPGQQRIEEGNLEGCSLVHNGLCAVCILESDRDSQSPGANGQQGA